MPLWGTRRSGGNSDSRLNFVSLIPGDDFTLLDGTETIVTGSVSTAFARGTSNSQSDQGSTFNILGCTNGTVIQFQSSNGVAGDNKGAPDFTYAQLDATFNDIVGGSVAGNGAYTDIGRASFYRCKVATFVAGDAPIVIVKR